MTEVGLFLVLFVALFVGWTMGRKTPTKKSKTLKKSIPNDYFRGLNHLLNDQHSEAIDAFVDSLEVNSETFDIHLTLGNLFRKKGEIQKAINIHQNLLARPEISQREMRMVQLELASDFMSAGLLDRAGRLLLNMASTARKSEFQPKILTLLVDLYEFEQSWDKAIQIGSELVKETATKKEIKRLGHFHCEMAQEHQKKEQWKPAYQQYKQALEVDPTCVRASIGAADVLKKQNRYRDAIKELKHVAEQDSDFVSVIIPQLKECYQKVWGSGGYIKFLQEQNDIKPSTTLIMALVEHYMDNDREYAEMFLVEQLRKHPTIKGFKELINIQIADSQGYNQQHLSVLYELIDQLVQAKHKYQCRQCGFSGHQLHWQCPSCKTWGVVKPIHGLEGE
ncbi:lipopolysaccharide assembly protein LapB [Marinomonas posidonica]|uniref:Lipopolysaccharide assembly protein B n=1 Tax=Marinomonas posidonica (strain CECT 7376 / NCIMB 14433 / IVIA-Po-181) TaxID=491952 RepID=F6CXG2_MARPP|nr:lipopolysaccharide assembly protein LapB [Marinomonas posidonica]AEF55578.1 Tetratricopeptide TPR_1 repeat-containing protein [Marinomonas posidonica IVIA-Po-181]